MLHISKETIFERMQVENPWWKTGEVASVSAYRRRAYFDSFFAEATQTAFRRAVILMGPRRVGKTVLIHQLIKQLIDDGYSHSDLLYLSMDAPIYNRLPLEQALKIFLDNQIGKESKKPVVCFDEIQVVPDWEVQLKSLVDSYPSILFIASGSAAAALRMKSAESGAGRFTDFLLPSLTFIEYLDLKGIEHEGLSSTLRVEYTHTINQHFINYINLGGYPEIALSSEGAEVLAKRLGSDIIEKVLLRDLPSLYGIGDIAELNALFNTIAYNTGQEVSLDGLSKGASISKNTLKRYLEYLEAAFLIKRVERIDQNGKRFKRATFFKVYLTSPSMRAALFGPVGEGDEAMGPLVETAIFCQWFHDHQSNAIRYARWGKSRGGEVDIVNLDKLQKPQWCVEVKWSDRFFEHPNQLKSLGSFLQIHSDLQTAICTTKTKSGWQKLRDYDIKFVPAAVYCYEVGKNLLLSRSE